MQSGGRIKCGRASPCPHSRRPLIVSASGRPSVTEHGESPPSASRCQAEPRLAVLMGPLPSSPVKQRPWTTAHPSPASPPHTAGLSHPLDDVALARTQKFLPAVTRGACTVDAAARRAEQSEARAAQSRPATRRRPSLLLTPHGGPTVVVKRTGPLLPATLPPSHTSPASMRSLFADKCGRVRAYSNVTRQPVSSL